MSWKHVSSKDPRKKLIVAKLKEKTGAVKVTMVKQVKPGLFRGNCLGRLPGMLAFTFIGRFEVTDAECGFQDSVGVLISPTDNVGS